MGQARILLDTNAYIRLARSVHPLLGQEFGGDSRYCLYAIEELIREFNASPRLRTKFAWLENSAYRDNCKFKLPVSKVDRKSIGQAAGYIDYQARAGRIFTSKTDNRAIATALVLKIPLVTDDQAMVRLASACGVEVMSTLALVRLMLDTAHIDMDCVRQLADYWVYDNDLPANFDSDYRRLFNEAPPKS